MDSASILEAITLLGSNPMAWLVIIPGILIGLIAGAIPGFSVSLAMAIFLPATLYMDFLSAMLFLTAVFTGGGFGTAIPAILINVPGSSSAVGTTFDGYPMTRQGRHNEALGLALAASAMAMLFSYIVLFVLVNWISTAVLALGPFEMLVIAIWGMTLIATLGGRSMSRGLLAGAVGLLIGTIGMNAFGDLRGTLGIPELMEGFPVVPALIGMFAAAELFNLARREFLIDDEAARQVSLREIVRGMLSVRNNLRTVFRGGLIGLFIGAIPGVGSSVANLVSYGEARRRSKTPEAFGKGEPNGVVAAESANSSSEGGSMATLLALGIPGGAATAVMLSAFSMHNITGGPRFMMSNLDIVYAIILANFVQGVLMVGIGLVFCRYAAVLVQVPLLYLVPGVLSLTVLGSYAYTTNIWGPITVFLFAAVGWVMKRYDYPVASLVIGVLLGRMVEGELLRSHQISGGDWSFVLERPIALAFLGLLILSLAAPLVGRLRKTPLRASGRSGEPSL